MAKIHGKNTDLYIAEFDLNADVNNVTLDIGVDVSEITSFEDTYKEFVEGTGGFNFALDAFWNGATDALDEELNAMIGNNSFLFTSVPPGDTVGNVGYSGLVHLTSKSKSASISGPVTLAMSGEGHKELSRTVVINKAAHTVDGQTASHNYGGAGSDKVTSYLHVVAYSGFTSVVVKVQESSDDGAGDAFADIITHATITGLTSERLQSSAAGEQYLRADVNVTGTGSITFLLAVENK